MIIPMFFARMLYFSRIARLFFVKPKLRDFVCARCCHPYCCFAPYFRVRIDAVGKRMNATHIHVQPGFPYFLFPSGSYMKEHLTESIVRLLISSLSIWVAAYIVPGIRFSTPLILVLVALVLGICNAILRPVLIVLTLPITLLSFGFFVLVINALILGFVAWVVPGFHVSGFGAAFFGWIILAITNWLVTGFLTRW